MEAYTRLAQSARYQIQGWLQAGLTLLAIARLLGVHKSTVSREVSRNGGRKGYDAEAAQARAERKRRQAGERRRFSGSHWPLVELMLSLYWSPEQVSGRLALMAGIKVSPWWIYAYIHADKARGGRLWLHLRRKKPYKKRGGKGAGPRLAGRTSIHERPAIVDELGRFGDWEVDTIIGRDGSGVLVTATERKSRYTLVRLVASKSAAEVGPALVEMLRPFKAWTHTLTSDNGGEFAWHKWIERQLGAKFYFADRYASWQRGANERANGDVRQFHPKTLCFWDLTDADVARTQERLNNRPRKCHGYQTPSEVLLAGLSSTGCAGELNLGCTRELNLGNLALSSPCFLP